MTRYRFKKKPWNASYNAQTVFLVYGSNGVKWESCGEVFDGLLDEFDVKAEGPWNGISEAARCIGVPAFVVEKLYTFTVVGQDLSEPTPGDDLQRRYDALVEQHAKLRAEHDRLSEEYEHLRRHMIAREWQIAKYEEMAQFSAVANAPAIAPAVLACQGDEDGDI